jgi:hypothetical protein
MRERPWDVIAVRLYRVFGYEIRLEGWQFPMPKDDLRLLVIHSDTPRRHE